MSEVLFDADLKKALRIVIDQASTLYGGRQIDNFTALRIVLEWAQKIGLITAEYFQDRMKTITRFSGNDFWEDWDEWEKEHLAETQPAEVQT